VFKLDFTTYSIPYIESTPNFKVDRQTLVIILIQQIDQIKKNGLVTGNEDCGTGSAEEGMEVTNSST